MLKRVLFIVTLVSFLAVPAQVFAETTFYRPTTNIKADPCPENYAYDRGVCRKYVTKQDWATGPIESLFTFAKDGNGYAVYSLPGGQDENGHNIYDTYLYTVTPAGGEITKTFVVRDRLMHIATIAKDGSIYAWKEWAITDKYYTVLYKIAPDGSYTIYRLPVEYANLYKVIDSKGQVFILSEPTKQILKLDLETNAVTVFLNLNPEYHYSKGATYIQAFKIDTNDWIYVQYYNPATQQYGFFRIDKWGSLLNYGGEYGHVGDVPRGEITKHAGMFGRLYSTFTNQAHGFNDYIRTSLSMRRRYIFPNPTLNLNGIIEDLGENMFVRGSWFEDGKNMDGMFRVTEEGYYKELYRYEIGGEYPRYGGTSVDFDGNVYYLKFSGNQRTMYKVEFLDETIPLN